MLDLTKFKITPYELKWFDGEIIKLNMPSQKMVQQMVNLTKLEDVDDQLKEMKKLLKDLLNTNTSGRKFVEKEINELSLDIVEAIFSDYMDYVSNNLGE